MFVRHLAEQVQVDLVILQKYKDENDGYKYIFMAIEILSRFAFALPLRKKDGPTTKHGMQIFLEEFHGKYNTYPHLMQFDEGGEFLNKDVIPLLKSHDITYFTTASKRKASIVERLNRTIQTKLKKLFEHQGDHEWVSNLSDIIENYNTTQHREIGMSPSEVNDHNQFTVWGRLFGHVAPPVSTPRFQVGDVVSVLHFDPKGKDFQTYFRKKYPKKISHLTEKPIREHLISAKDKPPFSEETFEIKKVLLGDPVVYKLYSPEADLDILGQFYEDELSLVK